MPSYFSIPKAVVTATTNYMWNRQPDKTNKNDDENLCPSENNIAAFRHRLLAERYKSLVSLVVELQSELDILKLDINSSSTYMDSMAPLTDQHFEVFEKRIEYHREGLYQFLSRMSNTLFESMKRTTTKQDMSEHASTMSQTSFFSMASSLSSYFSSDSSTADESHYDSLGPRAHLRRRKRQNLRHCRYIDGGISYTRLDLNKELESDTTSLSEEIECRFFDQHRHIETKDDNINLYTFKSYNQDYQHPFSIIPETIGLNPYPNTFNDTMPCLNDTLTRENNDHLYEYLIALIDDMDHTHSPPPPPPLPLPSKNVIKTLLENSSKWIRSILVISLATAIYLKHGFCGSSSSTIK